MKNSDNKPQLKIKGLTFFPIPTFDGPAQIFGADKSRYFNRYDIPDIPKKYENMVESLFFRGGKLPEMKPEVDRGEAMAATRAWLSSWAPAYEAKMGTVSYAFWVWCEGDLESNTSKGRQ